jgi:hypothetical protein
LVDASITCSIPIGTDAQLKRQPQYVKRLQSRVSDQEKSLTEYKLYRRALRVERLSERFETRDHGLDSRLRPAHRSRVSSRPGLTREKRAVGRGPFLGLVRLQGVTSCVGEPPFVSVRSGVVIYFARPVRIPPVTVPNPVRMPPVAVPNPVTISGARTVPTPIPRPMLL